MALNYKDYSHYTYDEKHLRTEPWEHAEERFRKNYMLHVETSKRHTRARAIPMSYRSWSEANIPSSYEIERERLLKIYISKEHYEYLVKREQHLEELERENRRFRNIENEIYNEMAARSKNPAVQKAYEKYKMLLELSK